MPGPNLSVFGAFGDSRVRLARAAAAKFAGAWFSCFLVMAGGDITAAFSFEHMRIASVCGSFGAAVAVALIAQMDRRTDSAARQATVSAVATFIGVVFARPMHFSLQWLEPMITAATSGFIAIVVWYAKRFVRQELRGPKPPHAPMRGIK